MVRALVVVLVVAACSESAAPPPPRDASAGPQPSGQRDLDGDGAADCWTTATDAGVERLSIQIGCAGPAIDVDVSRDAIALPAALASRSWARGIAGVLVGDANVGCERVGPDCPAANGGLRSWVERRTRAPADSWWAPDAYTPAWEAGPPLPPGPAAIVLEPGVERPGRTPDSDRDDLLTPETTLLRWTPPTGALQTVGMCDSWELVASRAALIAVDRTTSRWTWIDIGIGLHPLGYDGGDVQCLGDVVVYGGYYGVDSPVIHAIDPRLGRRWSIGLNQNGWAALMVGGNARTAIGMLSMRQLTALLATPDDELVAAGRPCPAHTGALLAMPPGPPCVLDGKADIDGRGAIDCYAAERAGNRVAGTMEWSIQVTLGCTGDPVRVWVPTNGPLVVVERSLEELTVSGQRWLGRWLAEDFGCVPAARGCPAPGPTARWVRARVQAFGNGARPGKPAWQAGTPTLPPISASLSTTLKLHEPFPSLLVHQPVSEPVRGTPPVLTATCDRYEVWTSPVGGAVVDRAARRWAWVYLATESYMMGATGDWAQPVTRGWCDDDLVLFELSAPDHVVVTEPAVGAWQELLPDDWKALRDAPDRVAKLKAKLRETRD